MYVVQEFVPALQIPSGMRTSIFELFSGLLPENLVRAPGALTEKHFYQKVVGSSKSRPCFPQEKGLLPKWGLLPKQVSVEFFSGLLQEFLVRAPGAFRIKLRSHCFGNHFSRDRRLKITSTVLKGKNVAKFNTSTGNNLWELPGIF